MSKSKMVQEKSFEERVYANYKAAYASAPKVFFKDNNLFNATVIRGAARQYAREVTCKRYKVTHAEVKRIVREQDAIHETLSLSKREKEQRASRERWKKTRAEYEAAAIRASKKEPYRF